MSLKEQLLELFNNEPAKNFQLDDIITQLKTKPEKREIIKNLNTLVAEKKIIKNIKNDIKTYRIDIYIPDKITSSDITKIFIYGNVSHFPNLLKRIENFAWKRCQIYGSCDLNYNGYGLRKADNPNIKIVQQPFKTCETHMSWILQEIIYKGNPKISILILCSPDVIDKMTETCTFAKTKISNIILTEKESDVIEWIKM